MEYFRAGDDAKELKVGRQSDQPGKQWICELRSPTASTLVVQGHTVASG